MGCLFEEMRDNRGRVNYNEMGEIMGIEGLTLNDQHLHLPLHCMNSYI